jgi:glycosyltransferase involved in cell wall biosynthesis
MRIGVDATCWQNNRGYGRHARSLLRALLAIDDDNKYIFFSDAPEKLEMVPARAKVQIVRSSVPTTLAASANGNRSASDLWNMMRALSATEVDLLLFPTVYSYVPVISRAKKVVVVHDIIAEKYPKLTLPRFKSRLFWNAKTALGRWQADAIVTVSEFSRRGIVDHFRLPSDRVFVVGEASDPIFCVIDEPQVSARLSSLGVNGQKRLVVYVGGFGPHKNLERLMGAFKNVIEQNQFADLQLVLVGEYHNEVFHSYYGIIKKTIEDLDIASRVIFTGYLPDEELVILLNLATVLVMPSLMEGFGLPAVEAAACGCPVIATTASPLPDLLGGGGIYVNPSSQRDLECALGRVLESEELRREMRTAGLAAARRLTWEGAARQMIDVFEHIEAR